MACKLNSILTPHTHWIVRPKIFMPKGPNPYASDGLSSLRASFFCHQFFCSHDFNIPKNLCLATIAEVKTGS